MELVPSPLTAHLLLLEQFSAIIIWYSVAFFWAFEGAKTEFADWGVEEYFEPDRDSKTLGKRLTEFSKNIDEWHSNNKNAGSLIRLSSYKQTSYLCSSRSPSAMCDDVRD